MSNTKQTAVSWLIDQILKERTLTDLDIAAAKQIEKEQIKKAYHIGFHEGIQDTNCDGAFFQTPENYYNHTYENNING